MHYRHTQLKQELTTLGKAFTDLSALLIDVAKQIAAPGVVPPDQLFDSLTNSKKQFETIRGGVHGLAADVMVTPLPKREELASLAALESLLALAAAAEEKRIVFEAERGRALVVLARVLSIGHKESKDFRPLLDCLRAAEGLRGAVSSATWPSAHPETEALATSRHPLASLLSLIEQRDILDDDKWIEIEERVEASFGKPLTVAASRGKLVIGSHAEATHKVEPEKAAAPTPESAVLVAEPKSAVPTPIQEVPKPVAVEAKAVVEPKSASVEPKPAAEVKPGAEVKAAIEAKPPVSIEPKLAVESKPAPAPAAPVAETPKPTLPTPPEAPKPTPIVVAAPEPSKPTPVVATPVKPAVAPPTVPASGVQAAASAEPKPAPVVPEKPVEKAPVASTPAATSNGPVINGVSSPHFHGAATAPIVATPPRELRIGGGGSSTAPRIEVKVEDSAPDQILEEAKKGVSTDTASRPQRWGFWRGNR